MSKKINLGPVTAYAIAVANGFVGSVQEWLASLKGEKGDQGEKGEKGDTGAQGPKGENGDGVTSWNQLEDKPFYTETTVKEVLAEYQPAYYEGDGVFVLLDAPALAAGETYIVNWNGAEYTCVAQDASALEDGAGAVYLGNGKPMGGFETSDPFLLARESNDVLIILPLDGSTTLTISIRQEVETIHPIDQKFLPSDPSDVPIVFFEESDGVISCNATFDQVAEAFDAGPYAKVFFVNGDGDLYYPVWRSSNGARTSLNFSFIESPGNNPINGWFRISYRNTGTILRTDYPHEA